MLVFLFSGNGTASAVPNVVSYPTSVSNTATNANADITTLLQLPAPTSFPWGGTVSFTPNGWGIATDADVPDGAVVGPLTSFVQLANNAFAINTCVIPVMVPFAMVESTVDTTSTIGGSPAATIWPGNADGADADLLPDSVTLWPTFLDAHLANLNPGGAPPVPIARYHGQILIAPPSPTNLELLTFAPGSIPDYPASKGSPTISILEDPLAPTSLSAISMVCTAAAPAVFTTTTILGLSGGAAVLGPNLFLPPAGGSLVHIDPVSGLLFPGAEGCAPAFPGDDNGINGVDEGCGFPLRQNPSTADSYLFKIAAITGRDTDNDGIENELDKCPLHVDAHTHALHHRPFPPQEGYNPRGPPSQPQDPENDNLPSSCDPDDFGGSVDEDGDFFSNGQDNCPLVGNPSQAFSEIPAINIGPQTDGMGDHPGGLTLPLPFPDPFNPLLLTPPLCDPNPLVSDGHAHRDFGQGPVCIGGTDTDGDGWCGNAGAVLDPDDSDASEQVEDIAFPWTCADGVDNDPVNSPGTDLFDSKCQLPNHDLRWAAPIILGDPTPPNFSTKPYMVGVITGGDTARIGFLINTTSQGLIDGCTATITSLDVLGSGSIVAGTDEIGFINHDSGGYPGPPGGFLTLAQDLELEAFATAEVTPGPGGFVMVRIEVFWGCLVVTGGPPDDFTIEVDVCHPADPNLGLFPPLFPLGDDCGLTGADGGQDRLNTSNDATLTLGIAI
ncbi:MAG: hypothetical protein V3S98_08000 [Dehalococcoidia bacterium]